MTIVIISSKYQVVIPKDIRHSLNLKSGQKMQMFQLGERIVLIPQKNIFGGKGMLVAHIQTEPEIRRRQSIENLSVQRRT